MLINVVGMTLSWDGGLDCSQGRFVWVDLVVSWLFFWLKMI